MYKSFEQKASCFPPAFRLLRMFFMFVFTCLRRKSYPCSLRILRFLWSFGLYYSIISRRDICFNFFVLFAFFGSNMGSLRVGRCLKSFLEVLRFVVTEYRAVRSHGDLIRVENYVFF